MTLQHLKYLIDAAVGRPPGFANRDHFVELSITGGRSFKEDRNPVVDKFRVNILATVLLVENFGRAVTHATIRHADRCAVVSLEDHAAIKPDHSICRLGDPI